MAQAKQKKIPIEQSSEQALQQITSAQHQGIVAIEIHTPENLEGIINKQRRNSILLILDGVQDPHNLGACMRSAACFAADAVIVPKDNSAPANATARKIACGGDAITPIITVTNLARCLRQLRKSGFWLYGGCERANTPIEKIDLSGPCAIVLGNEAQGLRILTREHCDQLFTLSTQKNFPSLNVSVAAGICLYQTRLKNPLT